MKKAVQLTLAFALALIYLQPVSAQDSTALLTPPRISISGYIDSYYFSNLNNPRSGSNLGASGFERIFDQRVGQFQLGLVQTRFAYTNSKSEVVIDLTFGPNADLGNYGNAIGPLGAGIGTTALAIKQAYFTYTPIDRLSFTVGQFGTHIGYEVIDAPVNYNYSLSNLFGNGPFYHLGMKANYAVNDQVGLMVGLVNNWDAITDNNRFKTVISQLSLTPVEGWNVYLNWIGGREDNADTFSNGDASDNSYKNMFDLTTGYQLTNKFYLGVNAAYGFLKIKGQDVQTWGGAALYSNYAFTDVFGLGVRAEYFDNTAGIQYLTRPVGIDPSTGNFIQEGTSVTALTLTGNISLADDHLLIKPEIRADVFRKAADGQLQQLEDSKGNYTKNAQTTIGVGFIYKF